MTKPRIGFIGLGRMGHGMAGNLVDKGFPTTVLGRRNRVPVDDLKARGAQEGGTAAEIARAADIVIICVTGSPEVEEVVFGADGLLTAARDGLIVVDCSTSEPHSTERVRAALTKHGIRFADAPLARTPKEAAEGRLNVMVGADADTFAAIEPALSAFAENLFHVGPPGAGHKMKLLNNLITMGQATLIAEALTAGAAAGVDLGMFHKVVSAGGGNSGIFQMIVPKALAGEYDGLQFGLALALKDLRYYTHMAEQHGVPSYLGQVIHQTFAEAAALGFGDRLVASLLEAKEKITGVKVTKT